MLLLLRHLGSLAASTGGDDLELRNACFETVKDLRRRPLLTTLALDGVAYNAERKKLFHAEARRALSALADALGYERSDFDLRSNQGGIASSGEITLHSDEPLRSLTSSTSSSACQKNRYGLIVVPRMATTTVR